MVEGLRKCPFCSSDHRSTWTWISRLQKKSNDRNEFALYHYCYPDFEGLYGVITIYGKTEEEVIERWNNGTKHYAD